VALSYAEATLRRTPVQSLGTNTNSSAVSDLRRWRVTGECRLPDRGGDSFRFVLLLTTLGASLLPLLVPLTLRLRPRGMLDRDAGARLVDLGFRSLLLVASDEGRVDLDLRFCFGLLFPEEVVVVVVDLVFRRALSESDCVDFDFRRGLSR
jgi:hypothetical protein